MGCHAHFSNPCYFYSAILVVQVDLIAQSFVPGKPGYERVKRCLSGREELVADFILTWDNTG